MTEITEQSALEALVHTQELAQRTHTIMGKVEQLLQGGALPAEYTVVRLTADRPQRRDDRAHPASKSIGLYNPSAATIYLAVGGGEAKPNKNAFSVPPNAAVVLPVAAEDVELGADAAALAGGDAVVFLFRFRAVQALFFGAL